MKMLGENKGCKIFFRADEGTEKWFKGCKSFHRKFKGCKNIRRKFKGYEKFSPFPENTPTVYPDFEKIGP